jgi:type IV pilus assembly protein PilA
VSASTTIRPTEDLTNAIQVYLLKIRGNMSSIRCGNCGLVNFADADSCRRCGSQSWQQATGGLPLTPGSPVGPQTSPIYPIDGAPPYASQSDAPQVPLWPPPPGTAAQMPYPPPLQDQAAAPYAGVPYGTPYPNSQWAPGLSPGIPYPGSQPVAYGYAPPPAKLRQGFAISSLIIGCIAILTCIGAIASPVGLVLGVVAIVKTNRRPGEYGGKGLAIAGTSVNAFALFVVIPMMAAITIPNLLAARMAANEASAIGTMRSIATAEATFQSTKGKGSQFGTLKELIDSGLLAEIGGAEIGTELKKSGYRFEVRTREYGSATGVICKFDLFATPESYGSSGKRSFYTCEDYVMRGADKSGREATASDLPLDSPFDYDYETAPPPYPTRRY